MTFNFGHKCTTNESNANHLKSIFNKIINVYPVNLIIFRGHFDSLVTLPVFILHNVLCTAFNLFL